MRKGPIEKKKLKILYMKRGNRWELVAEDRKEMK